MPFEYDTSAGKLRLYQTDEGWMIRFQGKEAGPFASAAEAAAAVSRYRTGIAEWDRPRRIAPDDLVDWTPIGDGI